MKKLLSTLIVMFMAISLAGCAGTGQTKQVNIKCPACGYTGLADIYNPDLKTK